MDIQVSIDDASAGIYMLHNMRKSTCRGEIKSIKNALSRKVDVAMMK